MYIERCAIGFGARVQAEADPVTYHQNRHGAHPDNIADRTKGDLPTNQNHRPILHVFQLAHAGMFGLFTPDCGSDDIEKLPLFRHPALFAVHL